MPIIPVPVSELLKRNDIYLFTKQLSNEITNNSLKIFQPNSKYSPGINSPGVHFSRDKNFGMLNRLRTGITGEKKFEFSISAALQ